MMRRFAELVDKPVAHFYGEEEPEGRPREVAELLLSWADLLMTGAEPAAAFDRVTGEPEELSATEREKLAALAAPMRDDLARLSGGAWELLSEAERRQVLHQIQRLASRRRSPAEP